MPDIRKVRLPWLFGPILVAFAVSVAGCNQGLGAFQLGVGNTPNKPPGTAIRILGQVGLPFSGMVYNSDATWTFRGTVPMSLVLVNGNGPVHCTATKLSPGNGILSMQITMAFTVTQVSSTIEPFGIVSVQSNSKIPGFLAPPPMAKPDVRVFVKGPVTERFDGQVEDSRTGWVVRDRAPTMVLFEAPEGKLDATMNQVQNLGPFDIDLLVDGVVVASASGGPSVTIREP